MPWYGVKAASKRKRDGEEETATAISSVNVEQLTGSIQQVRDSGGGVGVRGMREQGWER